jgi:hypothetical protein
MAEIKLSNTKEIEREFSRIAEILIKQGDENIIWDIIPDKIKKTFVDEWKESEQLKNVI